jgi:glycosyltransferase involved in cell wall biosynthesis
MRIGVDAMCWADLRGYGRFTRELVPAMAALAPEHTFVCFLDRRAARGFDPGLPNVEAHVVQQSQSPTRAASANGYRSPRDMLRLTWAVARARIDVFFSPSVYTYFPLPPRLEAVVTVHDAIADRFPELTFPGWRARAFWRAKVRLALGQARLVLTVSDFAAAEIARVLRVKPERIRVALEAPSSTYVPATPDEVARAAAARGLPAGASWFVYVGGFNPHKHVDLIVRAHAALAREAGHAAPHLLLVGPTDADVYFGDRARIERAIDEERTDALVHWLGYLEDGELRLLHAGALALVLVSACEGFGLPAVEAAACGTPVIATTESPLPQLLAGGGLFVPPGQVAPLTVALRAMAGNEQLRRELGDRARDRARDLTWTRGARAALEALNELP